MPPEQLSKALQHIIIGDLYDAQATMIDGLLNPPTIGHSRSVDIGELSPVGWPFPVLMYGSTKSASIPLELYFSTQLTPRVGGSIQRISYYTDFLESFCFPIDRGGAPPPMLFIWPNVIEAALVVASYDVSYERFYSDYLKPQAAVVRITARELRMSFQTAAGYRQSGMRQLDPIVKGYWNAGNPMNLKNRR
jgi:hypothetical protein